MSLSEISKYEAAGGDETAAAGGSEEGSEEGQGETFPGQRIWEVPGGITDSV